MTVQEFRNGFHLVLRHLSTSGKTLDKLLLLHLLTAYDDEYSEPLLDVDIVTDREKENICTHFDSAVEWLAEERDLVGSHNIRSILSGYTILRTAVFPDAKMIIGGKQAYHRGRLIIAELYLRYWAYGPSLGLELSGLTTPDVWWSGIGERTAEQYTNAYIATKSDLKRIQEEYVLKD